ncbi:AraC family transcriptional regulator [Hyalangium rubrum]|uniref:AraC family transcriptional regulator n=1 Tax=Hyalangium rubrum TaxID=3103134 RepID=A0ABU5GV13_9BACT|nr:AraC family transcriptional regulator [Hyalangium sp. s54d21]MDY7225006.1 AraC family transcriptional regulator [Hyalangium sp. s54d21]
MPSSAVAALGSRSVRHAMQVLDALKLPGVTSERLCREFGLSLSALEDPEYRIPYATLDALLERAVELSGDDNLGLHMANLPVVDPDDMASAVIATSPNLHESFERGVRYQRVWGDGERLKLEETERGIRVRYTPVGAWRPAHRHLSEMAMAQFIQGARLLTGQNVTPLCVRFVHPEPADAREHRERYGCPIVFRAPTNDIEFSREDAALPFLHADALVHAIFERQVQRELSQLPEAPGVVARVRAYLQRSLGGGDYTFAAVARALHLPARTLQRRLAEEGQSYAAILEELRRERASDFLQRRVSIAEVSFLLGYSDPSVFHRAFKRWWGMSPEAFRQRHGASR